MQKNTKIKDVSLFQYLCVSGMVLPGNRLVVRPSYLSCNSRGSINLNESPLQIEFYKNEDRLLSWGATIRANLSYSNPNISKDILKHIQSGKGSILFRANVPYRTETTRIAFLYNGIVLYDRKVSAHGPFFSSKPILERKPKKAYLLKWSAKHPDGLPLFFHVRTSADGGKTWLRLASRLRRSDLRIHPDSLAGGKDCVLEIVAYDGVNTTSSQIAVPDAPPIRMGVIMLRPISSEEKLYSPIEMQALAQVRGRPDLFGNHIEFAWYSGEKQIANGPDALWLDPPPGEHTLIVIARSGEYEGKALSQIVIGDIHKK